MIDSQAFYWPNSMTYTNDFKKKKVFTNLWKLFSACRNYEASLPSSIFFPLSAKLFIKDLEAKDNIKGLFTDSFINLSTQNQS